MESKNQLYAANFFEAKKKEKEKIFDKMGDFIKMGAVKPKEVEVQSTRTIDQFDPICQNSILGNIKDEYEFNERVHTNGYSNIFRAVKLKERYPPKTKEELEYE